MRVYLYLAILLPLCIFLVSMGVPTFIPGCTVDEGAGASSACGGIGPLLAIGTMGGFLWLLFGIIGLIPALLVKAWSNSRANKYKE